jgi:hypothetical protein
MLRPLKPLEIWIYRKLRQPVPRSRPEPDENSEDPN